MRPRMARLASPEPDGTWAQAALARSVRPRPSRSFPGGRGPHPSRAAEPRARSVSARRPRTGRHRGPPRSPRWLGDGARLSTPSSHPRAFPRRGPPAPAPASIASDPRSSALTPPAPLATMHGPDVRLPRRDGPTPMSSRIPVLAEAGPTASSSPELVASRPEPLPLLILSAWCGLIAGLLEVGAILLRKRALDVNQLYKMSRHFVWLIPLSHLAIFLVLGVALSILAWTWRRRGPWLAHRLLAALTVLPPLWAAFPRIYGPAGFLLALGLAARLVPALERDATGLRRVVRLSFPVVAGLVPILAVVALGVRPVRGVARGDAAAPATGFPQRPLDRAGYRGGRPSGPLWLRSSHQPDAR